MSENLSTTWLRGEQTHAPHTVYQVLGFTNHQLEQQHDWVQWAFPLPEISPFNPSAPTASADDLKAQGEDKELEEVIERLFNRYLGHLALTTAWTAGFDHNWLRITRVIRCMFLRERAQDAQDLYEFAATKCRHLLCTRHSAQVQKAFTHWNAAVNGLP